MNITRKKKNKNRLGQVSLIVLLVSALAMTVGLSTSRKTITETKIETDQELMKQAFNAAESGLDYYLTTNKTEYNVPAPTNAPIKIKADITFQEIGNTQTVSSDGLVLENNNAFFWFVGHNFVTGAIDETNFYRGAGSSVCLDNSYNKSLKLDFFYKTSGGEYLVKRFGYNFSDPGFISGFTLWNTLPQGICPQDMRGINFNLSLGAGDIPLLIVVKPIGGNTNILLNGENGNSFPVQGQEIVSIGKAEKVSQGVAADVRRKIKIANHYKIPAFMLETITAEGDVTSE